MQAITERFLRILWPAVSCAAYCVLVGCRTEQPEAKRNQQSAAKEGLVECINDLKSLDEPTKTVSREAVLGVLERCASEIHQIDGGSDMGIDFNEYEMTVSGEVYWVDMGGQRRGPDIGGWLEVHTVTIREGPATSRGEVIANLDFRK